MKVEIISKKGNEMKFSVEGVKPSFASALRRIMISEIPTMAIEEVEFKKNGSALTDEVIANRLGMIPLSFDRKAYEIPEEGKKKTSKNQVTLVLKKKGPCVVYSGDLKTTDKGVKPMYDKIPITELFDDDEIQFQATAELGLGKTHAKWQGAVVGYKTEGNKQDKFIFNVESICGIEVEELVERSAVLLEEKFEKFAKEVKKLK